MRERQAGESAAQLHTRTSAPGSRRVVVTSSWNTPRPPLPLRTRPASFQRVPPDRGQPHGPPACPRPVARRCRGRHGLRPGQSERSLHARHPAQRAHADRPRGPLGPGRRHQHLVPRRLGRREAGTHRVRAPVRAPDVHGLGRTRRIRHSTGCSRPPAPATTAPPTSTAPTTTRRGRPTRSPCMLWLEADRMGWLLPTMDSAKVDAAARRGEERAASARGQPALRTGVETSLRRAVPGRASLLVAHDRLDGGPLRRVARRRQGVLPPVLCAQQRGHRRRRRRQAGRRARDGPAVLRRDPPRPRDRASQAGRLPAGQGHDRGAGGPGPAPPDLLHLAHPASLHRGRRRAPPRRLCARRGQEQPPDATPGLRAAARDGSGGLAERVSHRRLLSDRGDRAARARAARAPGRHRARGGAARSGGPDAHASWSRRRTRPRPRSSSGSSR